MKFKKIEKADIGKIKSYLDKSQTYHSPYALSNIVLWDGCLYDVLWSEFKNRLIISENLRDKPEDSRIILPLPYNELSVEELYEILNESGYNYVYYVDDVYLKSNENRIKELFEIIDNDKYSDYIYLRNDLVELKGHKYSGKRNLINQFEKNYSGLIKVEEITMQKLDEIINLTNNLFNQIDKDNFEMLVCEKMAISRIKNFLNDIYFFGVVVYISSELKAFAIGSLLNKDSVICNFKKADKNIKGLYQFIDREFARATPPSFKFINKESDLGKESLRKAKISYHPFIIKKSYILKKKT